MLSELPHRENAFPVLLTQGPEGSRTGKLCSWKGSSLGPQFVHVIEILHGHVVDVPGQQA